MNLVKKYKELLNNSIAYKIIGYTDLGLKNIGSIVNYIPIGSIVHSIPNTGVCVHRCTTCKYGDNHKSKLYLIVYNGTNTKVRSCYYKLEQVKDTDTKLMKVVDYTDRGRLLLEDNYVKLAKIGDIVRVYKDSNNKSIDCGYDNIRDSLCNECDKHRHILVIPLEEEYRLTRDCNYVLEDI